MSKSGTSLKGSVIGDYLGDYYKGYQGMLGAKVYIEPVLDENHKTLHKLEPLMRVSQKSGAFADVPVLLHGL